MHWTSLLLAGALSAGFDSASPSAYSAPAALTLADALAEARAHSPLLAIAAAQVAASEAAKRIPEDRWLPVAGADVQAYAATVNNTAALSLPGATGIDLPRIGGRAYDPSLSFSSGAAWQPYASTIAAIGVQQQIFDFGRTAALTASAGASLTANRKDLRAQELDVTFATTVAFMAVLAAHQVLAAATSAVTRAQSHRDQAAALVQGQLRSRIFQDRTQAELSRFHVSALRATSGLAIAQSNLASVIGSDRPLVDAMGTAPALAPLQTMSAAVQRALSNDPALRALEARATAQREAARATRALTLPTVYATSTLSVRSSGATASGVPTPSLNGYLPQTPNWDIGLVANWTFLDPETLARAATEAAEVSVIEGQLAERKLAIVNAAQAAWLASNEAEQALPELQQALVAAQQNDDQANVRFEQGLGTTVEIADAETLLTDAQVQLAEGEFQIQRSRAQLERAMAGGL